MNAPAEQLPVASSAGLLPNEPPATGARKLSQIQRDALLACRRAGGLHGRGTWRPLDSRPEFFPAVTIAVLRNEKLLHIRGRRIAILTRRGEWFARTIFSEAKPAKEQMAMLQTTTPKTRPDLRGQDAIRLMADDMRDAKARDGAATETCMRQKGWRTEQIKTYGPDAAAVAERRSVQG